MNKTGAFSVGIVVGLIASGAILAALGWSAFRTGFSARTTPTALESRMAGAVLSASVPAQYRSMRNPMAASPDIVREGMEHYADHCASCHANNGSGDTMYGHGLNPPPPDLRAAKTQSKSDGELYAIIQNGVRMSGMPAFGQPGEHDHGSWELVVFLRHLPSLTPDEEIEMKNMNPITPSELKEQQSEENFLSGEKTK
jgi:mono/diheme cytochrome c family protein